MAIPISACAAAILAGGQSLRMGRCKGLLPMGAETMLQRTARILSPFDEILLSANTPETAAHLPLTAVPDRYAGAGPLAGLQACLSATQKPFLFSVPCDLPYFTQEVFTLLLERFPPGMDAMVYYDSTGRPQPLCGIYRRSTLPAMTARLERGQYRIMDFLSTITCCYLDAGSLLPCQVFFNMNTPTDYDAVIGKRK